MSKYTVKQLAHELGISRKTLYKKRRKYHDYGKLIVIAMNCAYIKEILDEKNTTIEMVLGCNPEQ